jgi:hypothetical protein
VKESRVKESRARESRRKGGTGRARDMADSSGGRGPELRGKVKETV